MPERFLLQVLRSLVTHGILRSTRGVEGGYSLVRPPEEVNLLEVIEAVDGPIEASSPMGDEVPPHTQERITGVLEHVTQQSREYLAGITFASLLKDNGSPVG